MKIVIGGFVFLVGTLLSAVLVHLAWLLYFKLSGTGNEKVVGFGIPLELIFYLISILMGGVLGGVGSVFWWLRFRKKKGISKSEA